MNENKAGETAVNGTWNSCQYNDVLERSCKTKAAGKREGPKRTQTKQNETYSGKMNSDAKKKRKKKIRGRGIEGLTGGSGVGPPAKKEKKTGRNRSTEQSNRLRSGREVYLRSGLLWNSPNT